MHLRRFTRLVLFTVATMAALPGLASAEVIFELGQIYNGVTPAGSAPWARATFTDVILEPNTVKLKMENLATGDAGQCITNWTFNVSDEGFLDNLEFRYIAAESPGSNEADTIVNANKIKASGGGTLGFGFDIGFDFDTAGTGGPISSGRFMQGETCVYEIEYKGTELGFGAALFDAKTSNGLLTSVHIQGIPLGSGTTSGAATVPEPSALVLWSLFGAAGMGIAIARRRRVRNG